MDAPLLVHLLAVGVLATANAGALVTTVLARRSSDPTRILRLLRVHHVLAARTLVPAAVVTLGSGLVLAYASGASLLAPWMLGTLVLFAVSALIGIALLLPEEARAIAEARRQVTARERTASTTLVAHTSGRAVVAGEWLAQVVMAAMFALMIVQPGGAAW